MSNAYRPPHHRGQPTANAAAAAAPTTAAPVLHCRSPKDDAPAYDPTLWSTPDTSYISTLRTHLQAQQQQLQPTPATHSAAAATSAHPETFLTSSSRGAPKPLTAAASAERRGLFHVVEHRGPSNIFCGCLGWLCPTLYARWYPQLTVGDVRALSATELARLMQLSLAAGEVEQSAMLARELSRRKLALQMELFPSRVEMPADAAAEAAERERKFAFAGAAREATATATADGGVAPPPPLQPQWGAASAGPHPRASGFSPARGRWQPGPDAPYGDARPSTGTYGGDLRGPSYGGVSGGGLPGWSSGPSAAGGRREGSTWGPGPNWN